MRFDRRQTLCYGSRPNLCRSFTTPLAAMHVTSMPQSVPHERAKLPRRLLVVANIGHLVPRADFEGRVHSVFAKACNLSYQDILLTLCSARGGAGPTTLRLAEGAPHDLRELFEVGERVQSRRGCMQSGRAELHMRQADIWHPAVARRLLPPARIEAHLRSAVSSLAHWRRTHASVIDGAAAAVVAALGQACRALDTELAIQQVRRLIGWGEGLTPAGDDFLVGLMASLDANAQRDPQRCRFRGAIAEVLVRSAHCTTPIAAHYLRLAAGGHHGQPLVDLRNALLDADRSDIVNDALVGALGVGATSGADMVGGFLTGFAAWLPPAATATVA
jgi:hypothetical protein